MMKPENAGEITIRGAQKMVDNWILTTGIR